MSLTSVKMTEEVWLTCLTHALSTETEEILGLLLGDIEVFIFIFSLHNNQAIPFQFFIYYMCFLFVFFIGCAVFLGYSLKLCNFLTTCLNGNGIEFVFFQFCALMGILGICSNVLIPIFQNLRLSIVLYIVFLFDFVLSMAMGFIRVGFYGS